MLDDIQIELILIEDSEDDAELTMRALKSANIVNSIVWLKDGEEGVHYLRGEGKYSNRKMTKRPKLILLDLHLPKFSGVEVLEIIKNDLSLQQIPVVIMTSSRESKDLQKCYVLGANSYVVKPINYKDFIETAKQIGMYWILLNQSPDG